jgi:hypothetical protein
MHLPLNERRRDPCSRSHHPPSSPHRAVASARASGATALIGTGIRHYRAKLRRSNGTRRHRTEHATFSDRSIAHRAATLVAFPPRHPESYGTCRPPAARRRAGSVAALPRSSTIDRQSGHDERSCANFASRGRASSRFPRPLKGFSDRCTAPRAAGSGRLTTTGSAPTSSSNKPDHDRGAGATRPTRRQP